MNDSELGSLIERCYPRIRRAAVLLTGNASEAEDLAQETFLQAMQSWHRFDRQTRVETWLYAILLNLERKRRRGYVRGWRRLMTWLSRRGGADGESPAAMIETHEWQNSLWNAVGQLPEMQRQVIVLRYAEGLSNDEVAEIMQCPNGTVKSRLHHGLAALKQKLGRDWSENEEVSPRTSCCGERP